MTRLVRRGYRASKAHAVRRPPRLSEFTLAAPPHGPAPMARPSGTTVSSPPRRQLSRSRETQPAGRGPAQVRCPLTDDRRCPLGKPGFQHCPAACHSHRGSPRRWRSQPGGTSWSGRGRGSACGTGSQLALRSWLGPHFEAASIFFRQPVFFFRHSQNKCIRLRKKSFLQKDTLYGTYIVSSQSTYLKYC